jgi:hypothetical protein
MAGEPLGPGETKIVEPGPAPALVPAPVPTSTPAARQLLVEAQALALEQVTPEGVIFTFGGEKVAVPLMSFWTLEKVWDKMAEIAALPANLFVHRIRGLLEIVSICLEDSSTPYSPEELSRKLRGSSEWTALTASYGVLLVESGLIDRDAIANVAADTDTDTDAGGGGRGGSPMGEAPGGEVGLSLSSSVTPREAAQLRREAEDSTEQERERERDPDSETAETAAAALVNGQISTR